MRRNALRAHLVPSGRTGMAARKTPTTRNGIDRLIGPSYWSDDAPRRGGSTGARSPMRGRAEQTTHMFSAISTPPVAGTARAGRTIPRRQTQQLPCARYLFAALTSRPARSWRKPRSRRAGGPHPHRRSLDNLSAHKSPRVKRLGALPATLRYAAWLNLVALASSARPCRHALRHAIAYVDAHNVSSGRKQPTRSPVIRTAHRSRRPSSGARLSEMGSSPSYLRLARCMRGHDEQTTCSATCRRNRACRPTIRAAPFGR